MQPSTFLITIPMPSAGESIVDGVLVSWLVQPGEPIAKGQCIAEIETEKSVWRLESPCAGTVTALRAEAGDRSTDGRFGHALRVGRDRAKNRLSWPVVALADSPECL